MTDYSLISCSVGIKKSVGICTSIKKESMRRILQLVVTDRRFEPALYTPQLQIAGSGGCGMIDVEAR